MEVVLVRHGMVSELRFPRLFATMRLGTCARGVGDVRRTRGRR
jgi:hypothetical protein